MKKQSVEQLKAKQALEDAWKNIEDKTISPPADVAKSLESILSSSELTFKYILVTGILAKYVNHKVHSRALQAGSQLSGAYDARSLCHHVVVPFEKTKGNLFGLSNEPFLNKPARHKEHDKSNPVRNKYLAAILHDVLEYANSTSRKDLFKILVHILRVAQEYASTVISVSFDTEPNYLRVINFVNIFLAKADGGSRLVAITGAFIELLNQDFDVKIYPPNVPDKFAETAGDIEIWNEKMLISATECKHRPLTLEDIRHGIRKAKDRKVTEYCFVFAEGLDRTQESDINSEIIEERKNLDVILIDIYEAMKAWASALNPARRIIFGDKVVKILREIRQFDTANTAANVWNEL
jgi:hypothetical protein